MLLNNPPNPEPHSSSGSFVKAIILIPIVAALAFLVRLPLSWTDQALFSGLLIALCILVGRLSNSRFVTSTVMMASIFCTLRYIAWRWSSSVSYLNHSAWNVDKVGLIFALLLLCAETYAVSILLLGYFQSARPLKRRPVPLPADISEWASVDVYIPTYNEPLDVVRSTVLAAMGIDWPLDRLNVYILDDGRRQEFQDFAKEAGVGYLTRFDNKHAKAGNINAALKNTKGEYIAIFDCDHIATRSFLQLTMGWFSRDKKLAMVQTPHHFYSPDPFERNLNIFRTVPNEGALFYGVVQDGNDLWNATFFCGSCAVIKREALEQIGGIAVETVTEDAHTALRLQRLGWNTAYIGIPQAAGLATGSLSAHVGQRIRWARGMVQILRTEFPLFASGLNLSQRLCYLNCAVHYLYAIPRLIFVSAPLVYLLLGKSNLYGYIWEILAYAAPHLVLSNMVNSRTQGDHRHSFWNEVYEMVLAPYILLPTTLALINPKWGKFNVTPKSGVVEESFFDWKIARPYLFLIAINLVAIIVAIPKYFTAAESSGVLLMNVVWAMLNTLMLGACIAVSYETKQRRSAVRVEVPLSATLMLSPEEVHHCRVIDLSEGGVALRSDRVVPGVPGQPAEIVVRAGSEEFRFIVETVRTSDNRAHFRFLTNDLKHQRAVTKLIYARADSWLDWTKDQSRDRILSSLVNVFGIGARGIWMLPSLLIQREAKAGRKTSKSAAAKVLPLLLMIGFFGAALTTRAGQPPPPPKANPSERFTDHQSLADLGRKAPLLLHGDQAKAALSFVIPGTKIVDAAELAVYYQAEMLDRDGSFELSVALNDVEVTTLPVTAKNASSEAAHVTLPADLLVHDNAISFQLRRVCLTPCKHDTPGESWLRVETTTALETAGMVLQLPDRLSMLPSPFFDPSVHRSMEMPLVFETQPDLPALKAAGVLASWYGAMAGYRGSHFLTEVGQFPKGNVILLATSGGALAASLGLSGSEAQVAICENPADRYGKVLALVADSTINLERLSRFVARHHFTEDGDRTVVGMDSLSEQTTESKTPSWLDAGRPLRIANNLSDNLLHARIGSPTKLYFRIAPDLDYGTAVTVPLHLAYRLAGLSDDDHIWVSIRLNDTFVTKRRLSSIDCGSAKRQSFAVPVSLLYPSNTLSVELITNRSDTTVSDPAAVDLQVEQTTELDLGNPNHYVRMPRLDLFAAAGYPFTSKADGSDTTVLMPEMPTTAQIGLYLDAMSFLSSQTGSNATNFDVITAKTAGANRDRNILLIGSSNDEAPFRHFESSMVVVPANGKFEAGESTLSLPEWFSRAWLGRKEESEHLASFLEAGNGPKFLLEEFASPFRQDRSVVLLATRSETDEAAYFDRLAESSREGWISGGVAMAGDARFTSFDLSARSYTLKNSFSVSAVYGWLRFHLWILPVILVGISMLLAYLWEQLLERQAERRLQAAA